MQLLVIQNGKRRWVPTKALLPAREGNLQTLAEMLPMVQRDAVEDLELRKLVLRLIANCPNEFECQAGKLFEYARSIKFVRDPIDAERIADSATTIAEQAGDCGDKAILLAAMLGSIGYVSRFVAVNFYDDLAQHGYDHLYLEVQRDDAAWVPLDATPEWAEPGWEAKAPVRTVFAIWNETSTGVGGIFDDLISQGIQLGTQYAAGAVQQSRISGEQERQIGAQFDNLAGQTTALFNQIQAQPVITQQDLQTAVAAYQQLAQVAQQYGSIDYVSEQWNSRNYKPAYEERLRQMATAAENAAMTTTGAGGTPAVPGLAGISSMLSNPLAWVAIALLGVALVKR